MSNTTDAVSVAASLRDARVALRSAWYDAALEILETCEDWSSEYAEEAILIKAETIGRRDPVAAVEYLTTVDDIPVSPAGRFGLAVHFGQAHAAVRNFASAHARYEEGRALAASVPHGTATMAYHDLRMRWLERRCDPAAPEAALAVAHPDPSIAASAYAYRGWLHAGLGDYAEHIADLRRSVAYAGVPTAEPVDVTTLAITVHALAQICFERADTDGMAAARAAFEQINWTPDVAAQRFQTIRALGWDWFMRGHPGRAQWAFKDARAIAPSGAWRVMAHLDRAYVARMSRNDVWAIEELAEADSLAYGVRWESAYGEERQVLVMLSVLHSSVDAPRAQRYASMYAQIGTENVNPGLAVHGDKRAWAHAAYANGRIDQTLGRKAAAIASLTEAFRIFEESSYHYRATLAASALAELTGEPRWRDAALEHARAYPDCPLASVVDEAVASSAAIPPALTAFQRQIAQALWNGVEVSELSRRFSRSVHTIEQQIARVHAAFGVNGHGAFLEEVRRRRLA